jgi:hypothetical protein
MKSRIASNRRASFPHKGSVREQVRYLLRYAVQAPSMHNSQPWRFRVTDSGVEVFADREHLPPADDPDGRGVLLALGAAIHHLEVAMRCYGLEPVVVLAPASEREGQEIATVRVVGALSPGRDDLELLGQILRRHVPYPASDGQYVPECALMTLRRSLVGPGSGLVFLDDDWVAKLVAEQTEADDELLDTYAYAPVRGRIHPDEPRFRASRKTVELPSGTTRMALSFLHQAEFGLDHRLCDSAEGVSAPAMALLYTAGDSTVDLLNAGRSLGRLVLNAGRHGLRLSPRYELWDVPGLFDRLREETHLLGVPQLVLRIGTRETEYEVPRRPVGEALLDEGPVWPSHPSDVPRGASEAPTLR